jgi:hypothetical protein
VTQEAKRLAEPKFDGFEPPAKITTGLLSIKHLTRRFAGGKFDRGLCGKYGVRDEPSEFDAQFRTWAND